MAASSELGRNKVFRLDIVLKQVIYWTGGFMISSEIIPYALPVKFRACRCDGPDFWRAQAFVSTVQAEWFL